MRDLLFPPWRWGVFQRKRCEKRFLLEASQANPLIGEVYTALLTKGFRETVWQYVYRGQIGGLVRTYGKGLIEVHTRFFDNNTIYTEVEIGRTGLAHFAGKRIYGNLFIDGLLKNSMSLEARNYLNISVTRHKETHLLFIKEWRRGDKFLDQKLLLKVQNLLGSWVFIAALMIASILLTNYGSTSVYLAVIPILILVYTLYRNNKY
jgi:hypothetical protein